MSTISDSIKNAWLNWSLPVLLTRLDIVATPLMSLKDRLDLAKEIDEKGPPDAKRRMKLVCGSMYGNRDTMDRLFEYIGVSKRLDEVVIEGGLTMRYHIPSDTGKKLDELISRGAASSAGRVWASSINAPTKKFVASSMTSWESREHSDPVIMESFVGLMRTVLRESWGGMDDECKKRILGMLARGHRNESSLGSALAQELVAIEPRILDLAKHANLPQSGFHARLCAQAQHQSMSLDSATAQASHPQRRL